MSSIARERINLGSFGDSKNFFETSRFETTFKVLVEKCVEDKNFVLKVFAVPFV